MSFYLDASTTPPTESRFFESENVRFAEMRARDLLAKATAGEIEIYDDAGRIVATITKEGRDQCPSQ